MKLITVTLPDDHNGFLFGDVHLGSELCHMDGFDEMVDAMHSPYDECRSNYGYHMGDAIEAIMNDDKRFYAENDRQSTPIPLRQMELAIEKERPIAPMLVVRLQGNHERKLWKFGNITEEICKELNVPYGTYSCKVTALDRSGKLMYKMYLTHGSKSITSTADDPIRRQANMRLILKRHLKNNAADCAIMGKGHTHKLIVSEPESSLYLTDDGDEIKQHYTSSGQNEPYIHPDARWYVNTGSFVKLFGDGTSGYAEIAEYDPIELGFAVVKVRDRKIVSVDPYYV